MGQLGRLMAKRPSTAERRSRRAATLQLFVQQYARKAHSNWDPNDRRYDREVESKAKRMRPEALDALLRHGDDEPDGP